jgi:hypothetical protein
MTIRSTLFSPASLSLFVAMTASMLGSTPASAQATAAAARAAAATGAAVSTPATTVAVTTTATDLVVPIKGTVIGLPESVSFHGVAHLSANVVTDPDFGAVPTVVLSIDLGKINGIGSSTGTRYTTSTTETLNRRLSLLDTVQFTFPFFPSGTTATSPRVGMASFNLSFNVITMQLMGAQARSPARSPRSRGLSRQAAPVGGLPSRFGPNRKGDRK